MEDSKEIKLHDFYQACILKTVGFSIIRLERNNSKFVEFVFEDPKSEAETVLMEYWNRNLKIQAKDLIENISELKTRIYSGV
jgi:hypothetical protein